MSQEAACIELNAMPTDPPAEVLNVKILSMDELPDSECDGPGASAPLVSEGSVADRLGEILQQLESLAGAQEANGGTLEKIGSALAAQESLPRLMSEARLVIEQRNVVNKAMFEALHAELKGYKDGFLMEALHRPIIRDLISIFDDTSDILRQLRVNIVMQESRGGVTGGGIVLLENVNSACVNIEHNIGFVLEVLERMEVTMMPTNTGKLDKQRQRANSVEPTDDAEMDQMVVKVLKRGFQWKERVVRPEEVIIKKWSGVSDAAAPTAKLALARIASGLEN